MSTGLLGTLRVDPGVLFVRIVIVLPLFDEEKVWSLATIADWRGLSLIRGEGVEWSRLDKGDREGSLLFCYDFE